MQLMFSFQGGKKQVRVFSELAKEYNLHQKKLSEFTELDKIIFQNIKRFAGNI